MYITFNMFFNENLKMEVCFWIVFIILCDITDFYVIYFTVVCNMRKKLNVCPSFK